MTAVVAAGSRHFETPAAASFIERTGLPQPRMQAVALLSLLLHAALIVAWLDPRAPAPKRPVPRMAVRIIAVPFQPPAAAPRTAPATAVTAPDPAARLARSAPQARATRAADTPPLENRPGSIVAPDTAAEQPQPAPPPPTAAAPSPPLRLNLPPSVRSGPSPGAPSVREQALNDARSNTLRRSMETRLAEHLGSDDTLREEDLGDGRRRFRKGAACVDVHGTNIAQLNPFDERLRHINVAKACQ